MDALEALTKRRSIRKFKPEQIKDEELQAVINAGMYAPTAIGLQSPLIVAVQDPEDVMAVNKLKMALLPSGVPVRPGIPYYGAPTIIIVFMTKRAKNELLGTLDAAAVNTNMLNAAYALGLGGVWIHGTQDMFKSDEGKKLLEKWGITEEVEGVASMALGYKDCEDPEPKPRREDYYRIIK